MAIKIRRARRGEAETISALSMRSKRSNGYDEAFMTACLEELTVTEVELIEREFWVADAGVICGCACLIVEGDDGFSEVHALFIDPEYQRQGIGQLLWAKMVEQAKVLGLKRLRLDADPFAVPFYEAMGLVTIGHSPSGSIPGRSLPRMEFELNE